MECLICHQRIQPGERIFAGTGGVCRVDPEWEDCCLDFSCSGGSEELVGAIHLSCLESPTVVATTPDTVHPDEVVEEEFVVQRSDALSLFDLEI